MPIVYAENSALFEGNCDIDLAEEVDQWLAEHPAASVDLSALTRAHGAIFQVFIKHRADITAWPAQGRWDWVQKAIQDGIY